MSGPLALKPQSVEIDAPRELVFQMLTSFRRGRIAGDDSESSNLISEDGNTKVVEFRTKAGPVHVHYSGRGKALSPSRRLPSSISKGRYHFSEEAFTFEENDGGQTVMTHTGSFIWKRFPFFGWLGGVIYTRPMYHRVIRKHLAVVKEAAEARAARSHVFRRGR